MHPTPSDPVSIIPDRDLRPKPVIDPELVRISITEMAKDSVSGPEKAGFRWILLVATNELRSEPDLSGLDLLRLVVQKTAAGDFTAPPPPLRKKPPTAGKRRGQSASNRNRHCSLTPSDTVANSRRDCGGETIPISPHEGFGVKCRVDAAVHEERSFIEEFGKRTVFHSQISGW